MASSRKNTQLEAALEWAKRGFDVLPLHSIDEAGSCTCGKSNCTSPGKHPRTHNGYKDASRDPGAITDWFDLWPDSNVGVVPASGAAVVLDIDPRSIEPEQERAIVEEINAGAPDAPVVMTGRYEERRGRHFWFRTSDSQLIRKARLVPGVDVKAARGYVLVPPSVHPSGEAYELAAGDFDALPALPDSLAGRLIENHQRDDKVPPRRSLTHVPISDSTVDAVINGLTERRGELSHRNSALAVARNLYEAGIPQKLTHYLMSQALLRPEAALDPARPWQEQNVREIVESVVRNAAPDRNFMNQFDERRFELLSLRDAERIAGEPIDWVIPGLLAAGEVALLVAPPKSKKTFIAVELCRAVVLGEAFLDLESWAVETPSPVVFVQEEHQRSRWATRLMETFGDDLDAPFHFIHESGLSLAQDAQVDIVIERARSVGARLVAIDPFQNVSAGVDENNAGELQPIWEAIRRIKRETNAAVLLVHHANKSDGELSLRMARGSSRITGEADVIFIAQQRNGYIEVMVTGRDLDSGPDGNLEVVHETEHGHRMRARQIKPRASVRQGARPLLELVLRDAAGPLTSRALTDAIAEQHGKPFSKQTIVQNLERMLAEDLVHKGVRDDGLKTAEWSWIAK